MLPLDAIIAFVAGFDAAELDLLLEAMMAAVFFWALLLLSCIPGVDFKAARDAELLALMAVAAVVVVVVLAGVGAPADV